MIEDGSINDFGSDVEEEYRLPPADLIKMENEKIVYGQFLNENLKVKRDGNDFTLTWIRKPIIVPHRIDNPKMVKKWVEQKNNPKGEYTDEG